MADALRNTLSCDFRSCAALEFVMSLTAAPVLHRLIPRRTQETTAFGYEVVARNESVDDCVGTVQWIDCWCPDAAQFILVSASPDLNAASARSVVRAIGESHLRPKIFLVCRPNALEDPKLLEILRRQAIGCLLATGDPGELATHAAKGILGVHVSADDLAHPDALKGSHRAREVIEVAHDSGMRSIVSQTTSPESVGELLGLGFDYASQRDGGFTPPEPSFAWRSRLAHRR